MKSAVDQEELKKAQLTRNILVRAQQMVAL